MSGSPSYTYRPTFFVPSPTICQLFVADETKSRVVAADTLFRSKPTGRAANFIFVQSVLSLGIFTVTLTQKDPQTLAVIKTLTYHVTETNIDPLATSTAVADLRSQLSADVNNTIVELPLTDRVFTTYVDPAFFGEFVNTVLTGADGLPLPYDPTFQTIRTGPDRTLGYSNRTDLGSSFANTFQKKEWNGSAWVNYVPFT